MGIIGLEAFVERLTFPSECCHEVSIRQLVEDFRKERGDGIKPIIIFHWANISWELLKDIDWVCGGQCKEALNRIQNFIAAFKRLHVHPVFFIRGYSNTDAEYFDRDSWIEANDWRLRNVISLFKVLENGTRIPDEDPSSTAPFLQNISFYFSAMFDCEVHKATRECNIEMVMYARRNPNCIAIFAQDSDFMIYEFPQYYLSSRHFDLENMRTLQYSKSGLANLLGLPKWQLSLFGTLAGRRHFVPLDELLPFYTRLTRGPTPIDRRFRALVKYIRGLQLPENVQEHLEEEPEELRRILPQVAMDALNNEEAETRLLISLQNFRPREEPPPTQHNNPEWDAIIRRGEELHKANILPTLVRKILQDQPFEYMPTLEDLSNNSTTDLLPSAVITRPLRKQIYKIILAEKPEPHPLQVTEYSMERLDDANEPIQISIDAPQDGHPGLMQLWSDDRSDELQRIRWTLFAQAVSQSLQQIALENLPKNLILPAMTLVYLQEYNTIIRNQENQLRYWEIEALIAMAVLLRMNVVEPKPNRIIPRAVHLASIFNRTLYAVMDLLAVCGYPLSFSETFNHPYFDGKLFQRKYREASDGAGYQDLCQHDDVAIADFQAVRAIVFRNQ